MNGSTKILTVSYGTFSCTLEGFDDPLGTMRELAEYFRDLAADDRYFGAEPPTPDAEMLQNIAQREVRQKVEARTSPTGISLTKVDDAPVEVEHVQQPEPSVDPGKGPLTFDDDFLMADEPEDVLAVDPDAAPAEVGPAETVAEKLRRIRAVVSRRPEEDHGDSFSEAKAQTAKAKRDRALSETIRQIQDDLSDDDGQHAADVPESGEPVGETVDESVHAAVARTGEVDDHASESDEAAMSQLLENVSERTERIVEDEPKTAKPLNDENTDADVGRLLEETDNKLNEDSVVRRRQVISQMRAAVAATKADRAVTRLLSVEDQEEVEKKAYRNDLSDAVSDAAPLQEQEQPSARKTSGPPLVLVSSQRVDESDAGTQMEEPQPSAPSVSTESFARFVENNGAKGIEELLEAAAAYTVFSKGQESFSRPEIMKRVAMVDPALSMSREDGLRSFGQLLRQGKFQKLERGQFTIDRDTRFNPEKRIAGE